MVWLWIIIIVMVIGGIIGAIGSGDDDKGSGCLGGALTAGVGCGYVLVQIFIAGLVIVGIIWLWSALFG